MQLNKIPILCTGPLSPLLMAPAEENGLQIDIVPFIRTESPESKELATRIQTFSSRSITAVFTSVNAVESVTSQLDGARPGWRIYCLGNTTRKSLIDYFGENPIAGFAENASALANIILESGMVREAVFFCGDHRRDELPKLLVEHRVVVHEVIVYRTVAVINKIDQHYQGILFFSPSAVTAFFSSNQINVQTDLFAIGPTTAQEIRKFTNNTIVVSDKAGKGDLISTMIRYYRSLKKEKIYK